MATRMKRKNKEVRNMEKLKKEVTGQDILNYMEKNDTVGLADMQEKVIMNRRQEYLKMNPWKISEPTEKNKRWVGYIPDKEKKNGRRQIQRSTREAVEDVIVQYWKNKEENPTFNVYFKKWMDLKVQYGIADNTLYKYKCDYKRFFEGTEFGEMDIRDINSETISIFMIRTIKEKQLKNRGGVALWGYISGTFKSAFINRKITENPCLYVDTKMFNRHYDKTKKTAAQRTLNEEESRLLLQKLREDHENKPRYIPSYAVELATMTGLRVGEIVALKWSDIDYNKRTLTISNSEKSSRLNKTVFIAGTKNERERTLPLTDELIEFFRNFNKVQFKYGYKQEFVFCNERGRIKASVVSDCARNKSMQCHIDTKSIHAIRRTINSKMRCNGVSPTVAASILGNTPEVNTRFYTYDVTAMDEKKEILSQASL